LRFEHDSRESAAKNVKHGIEFLAAQEIWRDQDRLEIPPAVRMSCVLRYSAGLVKPCGLH
jgi:uncharacterized DUF497 family protein